MLILQQLPKCQFCESEAKYEAVSTDPSTIHQWVYVCKEDLGAKTISDLGVGAGRLVILAE
jgi:predicted RNA methylase